jgi:peptidoglycan/xylan/chitin deacetylase (PgdA/CDA1 family)
MTYHSLDTSGSVISTSPAVFGTQMKYLVQSGVPVAPLSEVLDQPGAVALTFDDGLESFYEHALPLLSEYRLPATVFVVSDFCGRHNNWPSQAEGIPKLPVMNWTQLREIAHAGIELGAHTATHPCLTELPGPRVEEELLRSKAEIEDRTGTAVTTLAYPYGESSSAVRALARRHFRLACGTTLQPVPVRYDCFNIPRIDSYYVQDRFWFESINTLHGRGYLRARGHLRFIRRALAG